MTLTHSPNVQTPLAESEAPERHSRGRTFKRLLALVILFAVVAGAFELSKRYPARARAAWEFVLGKVEAKDKSAAAERPSVIGRPWDGLITLNEAKRRAIGLTTV